MSGITGEGLAIAWSLGVSDVEMTDNEREQPESLLSFSRCNHEKKHNTKTIRKMIRNIFLSFSII